MTSPPLASHQTSVDRPCPYASQSMVSTTHNYLINDPHYSFIHSWVTGSSVLTSFSSTLPIPPGTALTSGLTAVRNSSAAHRQPWTERRSEVKGNTTGHEAWCYITPTVPSPGPVCRSLPKTLEAAKESEPNADIRLVGRQTT